MGDFIRVQHGAPPWEGSGHPAHHVETYHFHDIPLVGLIQQDGVNYLFRCFVGEIESINVWSYTLIEPREIEQLEAAASTTEFDALVDQYAARPGVAAISIDGYGIIDSVVVHDWSTTKAYAQPLLEAVEEFGRRLQADIEAQKPRLVAAG